MTYISRIMPMKARSSCNYGTPYSTTMNTNYHHDYNHYHYHHYQNYDYHYHHYFHFLFNQSTFLELHQVRPVTKKEPSWKNLSCPVAQTTASKQQQIANWMLKLTEHIIMIKCPVVKWFCDLHIHVYFHLAKRHIVFRYFTILHFQQVLKFKYIIYKFVFIYDFFVIQ